MIKRTLIAVSLIMLMGGIVSAQTFKYIGADKCKMCHNKPATGDQYAQWQKTLHSKALKSLASQASLDWAKKNGIADPTKEAKCLKCHSTYDAVAANLRGGILATEGVSCESCHGPGSAYKAPNIMKDKALAQKNGLIMPTKEVCLKCHNKENPFYKEFNFDVAFAKVKHPNPAATAK
jgi:nitrate/TMAO reductase-like tetraheme cytochrome c subunit